MKVLILVVMGLLIVACGNKHPHTSDIPAKGSTPEGKIDGEFKKQNERVTFSDVIIEEEVRKVLKKPEGELTRRDLRMVSDLRLNGNRLLRPLNDSSLKDLVQINGLRVLYLVDNPITDKGLKDLVKLQRLEFLHLSAEQITDAGLKDLSKLNNLVMLTLLGAVRITDKGLSSLVKLKRLYSLDLTRCVQITDKGIKELAKLKSLEKLMIGGRRFSGAEFKEITMLTHLMELDISYCDLDDLKGLEKLTRLMQLRIYGNPNLTLAQISELQKALPKCTIQHNTK